MRRLRLALVSHLESTHVGRVVYGAIIGLALVVALQAHPPGAGTVVALIPVSYTHLTLPTNSRV